MIIIIGSILVFTSLSFVKGRFDFKLFNTSLINDIVKVDDSKVSETSYFNDLDSINLETEQNLDQDKVNQPKNINSSNDDSINSDQKKITNKKDKDESIINDIVSNKDIENVKNIKPKSNFI